MRSHCAAALVHFGDRYSPARAGSLAQEDPLETEMVTHSPVLAWRIPWTEEPGGLQPLGSRRVKHNLVIKQQYNVSVTKIAAVVWQNDSRFRVKGAESLTGFPSHYRGGFFPDTAGQICYICLQDKRQFQRARLLVQIGQLCV